MTDALTKAAQAALEILPETHHVREALRAALAAQQDAQPVAEVVEDDFSRQVKGIGRWHDLPNGTLLYAAAQPQQAASMDALTHQMIAALAAIDEALGLPADGCNSTAATLAAIRELKAAQQAVQMSLEDAVRAVVAKHGGVRAAERATGVDKSFISRLMNGHKVAPSEETLRLLGLRAVPLYEVFDAAAQPQQAASGPVLGLGEVASIIEDVTDEGSSTRDCMAVARAVESAVLAKVRHPVPREPTESMCRAAVEAAQGWPVSVSAADVWVAMWDAAREGSK